MRLSSAALPTVALILACNACSTVPLAPGGSPDRLSTTSGDVPAPGPTALGRANLGAKPQGWFDATRATGALIYVAGGNEVAIFRENDSKPVGAITDGIDYAYGLFADAEGGLYVANYNGTIAAYRPGEIHPWITYSDPDIPLFVVADHSGRVYAANRGGSITEYPRQQTTPDVRIKTPGIEADGINLDAASNLYVAYRGRQGHGSIEEFALHSTIGRILGMHLFAPQGLQIDGSGNIIVVESGYGTVDIFPPGRTHPSQVVSVDIGATQIVLGGNQRNIYYSTYTTHDVYVSPYPLGAFQVKLSSGLNYSQGMALSHELR